MRVQVTLTEATEEEGKKGGKKRGGKGLPKAPKAKAAAAAMRLTLQRAPRGKNKSVTVIKGLGSCGNSG